LKATAGKVSCAWKRLRCTRDYAGVLSRRNASKPEEAVYDFNGFRDRDRHFLAAVASSMWLRIRPQRFCPPFLALTFYRFARCRSSRSASMLAIAYTTRSRAWTPRSVGRSTHTGPPCIRSLPRAWLAVRALTRLGHGFNALFGSPANDHGLTVVAYNVLPLNGLARGDSLRPPTHRGRPWVKGLHPRASSYPPQRRSTWPRRRHFFGSYFWHSSALASLMAAGVDSRRKWWSAVIP